MAFELSSQADQRADLERAALQWRRDLIALGVADADVTSCENALRTFARTTTHPYALVVAAGREMLRSQLLRGEPLVPSNPDAWASRLLARFRSPKFGTYWLVLPDWIEQARRVWSRPGPNLPTSRREWTDPFAEPPPSFRLHPMDLADGDEPSKEPAGEGGRGAGPMADVRRIGDAVTITRALGREAEGRTVRQDGRLAREPRGILQVNADRASVP
jgi:hypothetical protein